MVLHMNWLVFYANIITCILIIQQTDAFTPAWQGSQSAFLNHRTTSTRIYSQVSSDLDSLASGQEFTPSTIKHVNGAQSNNDKYEFLLKGGVFHVKELLYPSLANQVRIEEKSSKGLPLVTALHTLQKALRLLLDEDHISTLSSTATIRIEQPLSHKTDPLLWLHAQQPRIRQLLLRRDRQPIPSIYFANSDDSLEVSGIGNSGLLLAGDKHTQSTEILASQEWKLIQNLPSPKIRVYGGGRFDSLYPDKSHEWTRFLHGDHMTTSHGESYFFFLPAIELQRETTDGLVVTTLAINLHFGNGAIYDTIKEASTAVLHLLDSLTEETSSSIPPTLPAIVERKDETSMEQWEKSISGVVSRAKDEDDQLQKVVLARSMELTLGEAGTNPLDVLRKIKFGGGVTSGDAEPHHESRHLFYLCPTGDDLGAGAFVGSTPERLFRLQNGVVSSEALAGTRLRGTDAESDASLLQELLQSQKDMSENTLTLDYIVKVLDELESQGIIRTKIWGSQDDDMVFVRRLRHLQHLCRRIERHVVTTDVHTLIRQLLYKLHPTPAVCGTPFEPALQYIRNSETFDRGFYAGPFGYIGKDDADILVAIRSALIHGSMEKTNNPKTFNTLLANKMPNAFTKMRIYGGAGIVAGSTPQEEYMEIAHKFTVLSSLFPSSPFSVQNQPHANAAFSAVFVEELIRNGVVDYFICPGSRSTPLTVAIVRASRPVHRVGSLSLHSCIDERGAAYQAIGHFHRTGRVPAIITTSGTAVANLFPGVMEASVSGVPLLVLTGDRPYEHVGIGANQAVDQIKVFGNHVRYFRDIHAPTNDSTIAVNSHLSDASHAITLAIQMRGPVHLNIQFRENLAPEEGPIRGDPRKGFSTHFDGSLYSDVSGWDRWAKGSKPWTNRILLGSNAVDSNSVRTFVNLLAHSKRALLIVGNIRASPQIVNFEVTDLERTVSVIDSFASLLGIPIVASCQRGACALRFSSPAVIPYADTIFSHNSVAKLIQPDLIIQIGHPLLGSINSFIESSARGVNGRSSVHVLIHEHYTTERADPSSTAQFVFDGRIEPFLGQVMKEVEGLELVCSELAPLVNLGERVHKIIRSAIHETSDELAEGFLTEPQVILALAESSSMSSSSALFWSNSMPIRDAESYFYPTSLRSTANVETAANRGASGIDGIVSSALGFATGKYGSRATLVVGDVAALHDLNSFHSLSNDSIGTNHKSRSSLTAVVVNNGGGGIFSFLPIGQHGDSVGFDEFWGTPQTQSIDFEKFAKSVGITNSSSVSKYEDFQSEYNKRGNSGSLIECRVVGRKLNSDVHKAITAKVHAYLDDILKPSTDDRISKVLPMHLYFKDWKHSVEEWQSRPLNPEEPYEFDSDTNVVVLLHGWMGDKYDWEEVVSALTINHQQWAIISVDLPGHGDSEKLVSTLDLIRESLGLESVFEKTFDGESVSLEWMSLTILDSLKSVNVVHVDAVVGYSLGGRIALSMKHMSSGIQQNDSFVLSTSTKYILLSAEPSQLLVRDKTIQSSPIQFTTISIMNAVRYNSWRSTPPSTLWSNFLNKWYSAQIWGNISGRYASVYNDMIIRRTASLARRGADLGLIQACCSPLSTLQVTKNERRLISTNFNMLFVSGSLDKKYCDIGRILQSEYPNLEVKTVEHAGHALIGEAPTEVAKLISAFLEKGMESSSYLNSGTSNKDFMVDEAPASIQATITLKSLVIVPYSIPMSTDAHGARKSGIKGIGWGKASENGIIEERRGFIIELQALDSENGIRYTGLGEVAPLPGLHSESPDRAMQQLTSLQNYIKQNENEFVRFDANDMIALNGMNQQFLSQLGNSAGIERWHTSVQVGLEMALLVMSSKILGRSLPETFLPKSYQNRKKADKSQICKVSGLMTRQFDLEQDYSLPPGPFSDVLSHPNSSYSCVKVKIGKNPKVSATQILSSVALKKQANKNVTPKVRCDVNRVWNVLQASEFAQELESGCENYIDFIQNTLEFVEEPLKRDERTILEHVQALNEFSRVTGIQYALDETLYDLTRENDGIWINIRNSLLMVLPGAKQSGCAALVIKPSLLGIELSWQIANFARERFGMPTVFSSCFESGIGLTFLSSMASAYDEMLSVSRSGVLHHGLGTFDMLEEDILSPPFSSFVDSSGTVDVTGASEALLETFIEDVESAVDRIQIRSEPRIEILPTSRSDLFVDVPESDSYAASSQTKGRRIVLHATISLPFSDKVASERFTDLPQMPRWSPWLSSVEYVSDNESEWKLDVLGKTFKWRAKSRINKNPRG